MDIRDWPLDQIMQLPDCCFGRRWVIGLGWLTRDSGEKWAISQLPFPELAVLWEFVIDIHVVVDANCFIRVALGDQVPTSIAAMAQLQPLFQGFGVIGTDPQQIRFQNSCRIAFRRLRNVITAGGRKLVVESIMAGGEVEYLTVACVVSSVPREVPDWLVSGNLRSL